MSEKENLENQEVRVNDQRRFNPDGTVKPGREDEVRSNISGEEESASTTAPPDSKAGPQALPADFPTLILSLASSAQMALGVAPHPMSGKVEKNLLQAKHAIDLLGVLQEKTKGNLTKEEDQLLQALLTDLRMRYLEENQGISS